MSLSTTVIPKEEPLLFGLTITGYLILFNLLYVLGVFKFNFFFKKNLVNSLFRQRLDAI